MNIDTEYASPTSCLLFIAFFLIWDAKERGEGINSAFGKVGGEAFAGSEEGREALVRSPVPRQG